ncbi:MAG: YbaN family protein [Planctomycetota bacterium]
MTHTEPNHDDLEHDARGAVHSDTDFSGETRLARSLPVRIVLWVIGSLAVVLAVLGALLPILPTVPFLVLSAACYSRASTRFYNSLLNNRWFGSTIRAWRFHRGVPRRARRYATVVTPLVFAASIWLASAVWLRIALAVIAVGLLWFLWTRPVVAVDDRGRPAETPPADAASRD